jgi:small subunit ribosomal protein S8
MTVRDHIADLLTRIRNGGKAQRRFIEIRVTKMGKEIMQVLKDEGFIDGFLIREEDPQPLARVYLKYDERRRPVVQGLKRISKSSCRRYVGFREIPVVFGGMGISILSTPKGILVGSRAREERVGGELLCCVW